MRVSLTISFLLLEVALYASSSSAFRDGEISLADYRRWKIAERANPPIRLPAPASSMSAKSPTIHTIHRSPKHNLTNARAFEIRVPHSTIELRIEPTTHIDGPILGNALLAMHEWINDIIQDKGDGPLSPGNDPFEWLPSGPPRSGSKALNFALKGSTLPVAFQAESVSGEHMTWWVLLVAVEGLYLALPAVGRELGAEFEIWDWSEHRRWGYGEIWGVV